MWPFKRKKKAPELPARDPYVYAKAPGVVEEIMYDYVVVGGKRYDCKAPMVILGQRVKKGQPVGKV